MASEAQFVDATLAESLLGVGPNPGNDRVDDLAFQQPRRTVIVFVGMAFEARIASGPGVSVFSRGSRRELALAAESATRQGYHGIISFGVAGGLAADLRPGDWVIASAIVGSGTSSPTDAAWSRRLCDAIAGATYAPIIGVDTAVAEPLAKRELHRATGAAAVDMESHVVAALAAAHGLAFTALRVIVDPAARTIPQAALRGMGAGGRADSVAVLRDLMARPSQLSGLARVSLDAFIARSEMMRVRRLLGPHFGMTDLTRTKLTEAHVPQADVAPYRSPA